MKNKVFYLNNEKTAYVKAYLLDKVESIPFGEKRPAIIIFPGGGYKYCSEESGAYCHALSCGRLQRFCALLYL